MICPSSSDNGKLVVTGIKEDKRAGQSKLQVGDIVAKVFDVDGMEFDVDGMDASEVATKLIGTSGSTVTFVSQKGDTVSYCNVTAVWKPPETITELQDLRSCIKEEQKNLQALQECVCLCVCVWKCVCVEVCVCVCARARACLY